MMEKTDLRSASCAPSDCKSYVSADTELEQQIAAASDRLGEAQGREAKLAAWREMVKLIDQRTSEQVAALEAQRGLRT